MSQDFYSDIEVAFIIEKKNKGLGWSDVTKAFNKKFDSNRTSDAIKKTYYRYKDMFNEDELDIKLLKDTHRTRKRATQRLRENKKILDHLVLQEDLLEAIEKVVKSLPKSLKTNVTKKKAKSKNKRDMTLELLFSDVHYGKKVDSIEGNAVDNSVIRERVRKVARSVVKEVERESKSFNVERVVIAMLGDIIENADFHGIESTKACEFGTSRQVQEAIESIFVDLITPIARTGVLVDIICVTGNHDRLRSDKTYVKPGEENLTFIIYKTLELLSKQVGFKNVKFTIPNGLYAHTEIYGNTVVYEHGDEIRNINRDTLFNQLARRQAQIGKVVDFLRIGHFHEPVSYGQGRLMVNGSVPGQDGYADSKGFLSEPLQIMNYYVKTDKRRTCFFRSFPIYLQSIKK